MKNFQSLKANIVIMSNNKFISYRMLNLWSFRLYFA